MLQLVIGSRLMGLEAQQRAVASYLHAGTLCSPINGADAVRRALVALFDPS